MNPWLILAVVAAPSLAYLLTAWTVQRFVADRRATAPRAAVPGPRCGHRSPHPYDPLASDLTCQNEPQHDPQLHHSGPWHWSSQEAMMLASLRGRRDAA